MPVVQAIVDLEALSREGEISASFDAGLDKALSNLL